MTTTNPEEFHVPAKDNKGHSERVYCSIIPGLARRMAEYLQSRQFPYRTKGDLFRHALQRHLDWLDSIADVPIRTVSSQVGAIADVVNEDNHFKEFESTFSMVGDQIARHVANSDIQQAKSLVVRIKHQVELMPHGFWRDRYLRELQMRFHVWMPESESVDFTRVVEE